MHSLTMQKGGHRCEIEQGGALESSGGRKGKGKGNCCDYSIIKKRN